MKKVSFLCALIGLLFAAYPVSAQQTDCNKLKREIAKLKEDIAKSDKDNSPLSKAKAAYETAKSECDAARERWEALVSVQGYHGDEKKLAEDKKPFEDAKKKLAAARNKYADELEKVQSLVDALRSKIEQWLKDCNDPVEKPRKQQEKEDFENKDKTLKESAEGLVAEGGSEYAETLKKKDDESEAEYRERLRKLESELAEKRQKETRPLPQKILDDLIKKIQDAVKASSDRSNAARPQEPRSSNYSIQPSGLGAYGGIFNAPYNAADAYYIPATLDEVRQSIYSDPAILMELNEAFHGEVFIGTFTGGPAVFSDIRQEYARLAGLEGSFCLGGRTALFANAGLSQFRSHAGFPVTAINIEGQPVTVAGSLKTTKTMFDLGAGLRYYLNEARLAPFIGAWVNAQPTMEQERRVAIGDVNWTLPDEPATQVALSAFLQGGAEWRIGLNFAIRTTISAGKTFAENAKAWRFGGTVGLSFGIR